MENLTDKKTVFVYCRVFNTVPYRLVQVVHTSPPADRHADRPLSGGIGLAVTRRGEEEEDV